MKRREFLSTVPVVATAVGAILARAPVGCGGPPSVSGKCTYVEPQSFSLRLKTSLQEGCICFGDDSSVAAFNLHFSNESLAEVKLNPEDAGHYAARGRYYVYVKCDRDRRYAATIKMDDQISVPEYTGEVKGMLWERFTLLVVEHPGVIGLCFNLGAGARLQRVLLFREDSPYHIGGQQPPELRKELQKDMRRFVRPPGVRKVDSGIAMNFESGETGLHCTTWDGKYVWCGFSLSPSRLLRVNPADMSTKRILINDAGGLHHLVFDGEWLWAVHSGHNPPGKNTPKGHFKISRVDPETGNYKTFHIEDRSGGGYCSTFDGRHVWVGLYRQPACAVAIDRNGKLVCRVEIPDTPWRCFRSIIFDGRSIWGGLLTRPGKIVRIDPNNGDLTVYAFNKGEDDINSICFDGRYIWAGLETRPTIIVRYDPRTNTHRSITLEKNEDFCRALVPVDGHVYAALYCAPATVVKLTQEMDRVGAWHLGPGDYNARAAVHDGKHLWVGLAMNDWNPGQLWRVDK